MSDPFEQDPYGGETPPPTPAPPAPADHNPNAIRCQQCRQDLTGSMLGGNCPHCGAAIVADHYPAQRSSGMAVASMVLGIISVVFAPGGICCGCLTGLGGIAAALAVIFYFPAASAARDGRAPESSRKMALAGLICGIIGLVLTLAYIVMMVVIVIMNP